MSEEHNENAEIVREYLKAFNDRDREALAEHLAEDAVEHGVYEELHGIDEIFDFFDTYFDPFPDFDGTTETLIAEDETVAVRYRARGTHTGAFQDIEPTGQTVEWGGLAMYRIEGDEIAEIWIEEDRLGLLEQLEVLSRPAHLRI